MSTISLEDPCALQQLKEFLRLGEDVLVSDGGKVIAKVSKLSIESVDTPKRRELGRLAHLGLVLPDDFDDELPDSFWFGEDK